MNSGFPPHLPSSLSSLDFFGLNPEPVTGCTDNQGAESNTCITIRSVCDGRIVASTGSAASNSGDGITIRCYMPDGSLSNIFVTYNHLQSGTVGDRTNEEVRRDTELGLHVYQYTDSNGNIVAPHLHLEAFYGPPRSANPNRLRLNALLFFATTVPGIDLFYTPRTGIPEDEQPYDYYPVASVDDRGQIRAYEWDPFDQNDPSERNSTARRYSATRDEYRFEDYDLHISAATNDEWAVFAEIPGNTSQQPWDRIPSQGGTAAGLEVI